MRSVLPPPGRPSRPGHQSSGQLPHARRADPVTTFEQLAQQIEERTDAARRRRAAADLQLRSILDTARANGRGYLTPAEDARVDGLMAQRGSGGRELRALDRQVVELDAALANEHAAMEQYRNVREVALPVPASRQTASVHVGRNERTYRPDTDPKGVGFLRDVLSNFVTRDPPASERLPPHMGHGESDRAPDPTGRS